MVDGFADSFWSDFGSSSSSDSIPAMTSRPRCDAMIVIWMSMRSFFGCRHVLFWDVDVDVDTNSYGINNIRNLVGHKVPIESVEKSAAVRF